MSGAVELYRKATARGITPVVGLEAYVVPDHAERPSRERRNHLTLLAETTEGYYNLIKLCSAGYLEGYHRKPRISHELMARHADGIIALSGCLSGVVCSSLERDDETAARAELDTLAQIFGRDDVYVEVQHAGLEIQTGINARLRSLAADAGLPLVATCDAHYPCREDADSHEALLAIQTRDLLSNPKRFRFETKEFYLKTGAEMAAALPDFVDALPASLEIAERCTALDLPLGDIKLPRFPVPGGESAEAYLERLCREGLERRYPGGWPPAAGGAAAVRARRHRRDGLRQLLPDRVGLHALGARERRRRRPGPRLGGGVAGGLRAADRRPRPARPRPAVRALPQPGPQVDAGHRLRLLRRRPRPRGGLRHREVRPQRGRPHRDVRQAPGPRGGPRLGPRAGAHLRPGRPHRQARPGAPHRHPARGRDEGRHRAEAGVRRGRRSPGRSSTRPARSRAWSATRASTPPAW